MKKKIFLVLFLIIILGGGLIYSFPNLLKAQNLGVDLTGGFEIKYDLEPLNGEEVTAETVKLTASILRKRVDALGVVEPEIVVLNDSQIRVTLPGVEDEEGAREKLSEPLNLSFRNIDDDLLMTSDVLDENGASFSRDENGNAVVALSIANNELFYEVTDAISKSENPYIVIWTAFEEGVDSYNTEYETCGTELNDNCISMARVDEAFSGDVIIQGGFTDEQARTLATNINAGSFPAKLIEVSSGSTSASLGDIALNKTLFAGIIGIGAIMLVLMLLYRFAGLISSFSIIVYSFLIFLVFYLIEGSLSLSGIAAILIGIGMAIDANVITFERIKEELYEGRSLKVALKNGTKKSFSTIFDANITTFIVAIILFSFGESNVIGFGLLLIISLVMTILVMVLFMRFLLTLVINTKAFDEKLGLFIGVKKSDVPNLSKNEKRTKYHFKKWDFMKKRKYFVFGSLILVILGIISLVMFGLNLGIDFKGGSEVVVASDTALEESELEIDFDSLGFEIDSVVKIDEKTYKIILPNLLEDAEKKVAKSYFDDKYGIEPNIDVMSDSGNKEMTLSAFKALIIASIMIVIYVSIRFKLSYALAAIIALLHDAFLIIALFSIFKLEVSAMFIAAILAIVGYSINDTIVAFDRVRENSQNHLNLSNVELVNKSLRETFIRSIYTSLTTMIPVLCLIFLGSFEIINFNIALLIGLVVGTYSSIYIAPSMWLFLEKHIKISDNEEDEPTEHRVKGVNS